MNKLLHLLMIVIFCVSISACSGNEDKNACKLVKSMIVSVEKNDIEKINRIAPFTVDLSQEELQVNLNFWKGFAKQKYILSIAEETENAVFPRLVTFKDGEPFDSFIFECTKINGKLILEKNYKLESKKTTIDFIDLNSL